MNRHLRIFLGIFCFVGMAVCVVLAFVNGLKSPPAKAGVLLYGAVGVVLLAMGVMVSRDRNRLR